MSLLAATWTAAIATVGLLIGAGVTAWYARKAFREQSEEFKILQQQLELQRQELGGQQEFNQQQAGVLKLQAEELQQSLHERQRAQASFLFIELRRLSRLRVGQPQPEEGTGSGEAVMAYATNASTLPVYDAELRWHEDSALVPSVINPEPLGTLMPDGRAQRTREIPVGTAPSAFTAELRFRDANEVIWDRYPDGRLQEIGGDGRPHLD